MAAMKLLRDIGIRHLVTSEPGVSLRRAAQAMTDRGVGCAVVVGNEDVQGIITERDILRAVSESQNLDETTVAEVMTKDVVSGSPAWNVIKAVKTMVEGGFRHLLIMEMDEPVGIVSLRDLMDDMADMVQEAEPSA
jgi:CBS domain-containing protein